MCCALCWWPHLRTVEQSSRPALDDRNITPATDMGHVRNIKISSSGLISKEDRQN